LRLLTQKTSGVARGSTKANIIWERDDSEVKFTVLEILRRLKFYMAKRRRRRKQLLDDEEENEMRGYWKLQEEALDRILGRTHLEVVMCRKTDRVVKERIVSCCVYAERNI